MVQAAAARLRIEHVGRAGVLGDTAAGFAVLPLLCSGLFNRNAD